MTLDVESTMTSTDTWAISNIQLSKFKISIVKLFSKSFHTFLVLSVTNDALSSDR